MIKLAHHAALLSEALLGIGGQNYDLFDVTSYLQLASGIRSIEFETFSFDPYVGYCESADDFRAAQDKLWGTLAHRLSVFQFVWSALESYKDILPLVDVPKSVNGKPRQIDKLCYYISQNYKTALPDRYCELLTIFKKVATHAQIGRKAASDSTYPSYLASCAEGLYLVYEIRNAFAHGDFSAPHPDDEDPLKHPDIMIVALSTRILLLTIQIMTVCFYGINEEVDIYSLRSFEDNDQTFKVGDAFLLLHCRSFGRSHGD